MSSPKLSVVFVNYNSTKHLDRALRTLRDGLEEVSCQTLVVDNASRDLSEVRSVCSDHGATLVALRRNIGYGAAANRAANYANGEYLAIANTDLAFPPGAVRALVEELDANRSIGVVGPQLVYPDGKPQPSARRHPRIRYVLAGRRSPLLRLFPDWVPGREFLYGDLHLRTDAAEVDAVIGTFVVFRRLAFDQIHGFDEDFFMFAEDVDICRRLRESGWLVVLDPRIRIVHYYGGIRRRYRRFTEYHRLRALCRLLRQDKTRLAAVAILLMCAAYYCSLEFGWLLGIQEHEYSWQSMGRGR